MFARDYVKTKSRKAKAAAAKGDGSSHSTDLAELEQSEEKLVELGQTDQRVELSGGVREEIAELPADTDVYELDASPMRWKEDNDSESEWMQNQLVGSDVSVVSPMTVSPVTVDGKSLN